MWLELLSCKTSKSKGLSVSLWKKEKSKKLSSDVKKEKNVSTAFESQV
jgi:hypothetical protein